MDVGYYEPGFDQPGGPQFFRGMRGRGVGRFRDISPGLERIGRTYGRGFDSSTRAISPIEGGFVHRNDPNLSPREGDWICRNPSCGNLNFARRTYCNNCNKCRYDEPYGSTSHSPRRAYVSPPPVSGLSPRLPGLLVDRGPRRAFNGRRSPPRAWDTDDTREFRTGLFPRRGGKLLGPIRKDRLAFHDEDFRERGRSDWAITSDWDRRDRIQDTFSSDRRGLDRQPPFPRDHWIRDSRDRSRSPVGAGRLPRVSYAGRGRDVRRYVESYGGSDRSDNFDAGRGRIYRRGTARGRSPGVY